MPYIITNTSKGLNPKSKQYNKNINIPLRNDEGGITECVIGTQAPLILSGNYLPKEFHTLQVKGLITITNISTDQFYFIKQEEEMKSLKKEIIVPIEMLKEVVVEAETIEEEIVSVETSEVIVEKEIKSKKK